MSEPLIRFFKVFEDIPTISYADPSAMGSMPTEAFRYCEAMRTASAAGWYVFPPKELTLSLGDGAIYIFEDGEWSLLKADPLDPRYEEEWRMKAPPHLADAMPAFVTAFPFHGIVQVFSGYFVETAPGWSISVRPPANLPRRPYHLHEGIIETDEFRPCPLFVNLSLTAPGREVLMERSMPLFQVQLIHREAHVHLDRKTELVEDVNDPNSGFDWNALKDTVHLAGHANEDRRARYAISRRKRAKEQ